MLNSKSFLISLFVVFSVIAGATIAARSYQATNAQSDVDAQRQAELKAWQEKVDAWNAAEAAKARNTNMSSQGIMQLPNTGPSD